MHERRTNSAHSDQLLKKCYILVINYFAKIFSTCSVFYGLPTSKLFSYVKTLINIFTNNKFCAASVKFVLSLTAAE